MILFLFLAHKIQELLFISVPEECLDFIEQKPCEPSDFGFLWLVHWMFPFVVPPDPGRTDSEAWGTIL